MLHLEDLKVWLQEGGITASISFDNQPEDPSSNVTLIETGGLGTTLESANDRPSFQALIRGPSGREARDLAEALDYLILDAPRPFYIGARRVIDAGRVGGGPGYLGKDTRNRTEYSANYYMEIAR